MCFYSLSFHQVWRTVLFFFCFSFFNTFDRKKRMLKLKRQQQGFVFSNFIQFIHNVGMIGIIRSCETSRMLDYSLQYTGLF